MNNDYKLGVGRRIISGISIYDLQVTVYNIQETDYSWFWTAQFWSDAIKVWKSSGMYHAVEKPSLQNDNG